MGCLKKRGQKWTGCIKTICWIDVDTHDAAFLGKITAAACSSVFPQTLGKELLCCQEPNTPVSTQTKIPLTVRATKWKRQNRIQIDGGGKPEILNDTKFYFFKACISFWGRFYFSEVLFPPSVAHSFLLMKNYFSSPKYVSARASFSSVLKRYYTNHFSPCEAKHIVSGMETLY